MMKKTIALALLMICSAVFCACSPQTLPDGDLSTDSDFASSYLSDPIDFDGTGNDGSSMVETPSGSVDWNAPSSSDSIASDEKTDTGVLDSDSVNPSTDSTLPSTDQPISSSSSSSVSRPSSDTSTSTSSGNTTDTDHYSTIIK